MSLFFRKNVAEIYQLNDTVNQTNNFMELVTGEEFQYITKCLSYNYSLYVSSRLIASS